MQRRIDSILEALTNTAIGYLVAVLANFLVLPIFGFHPSFAESNGIALLFTLISVIRSYCLRRLFNGRSPYAFFKSKLNKKD